MLYTNEIIGLDAMLFYKYTIIMFVIYFTIKILYFFNILSFLYVTFDIPYIKYLNFFIIFNYIINMLQF